MNQKQVAVISSIIGLYRSGWSRRKIARELGVDRETVGRYVGLWRQGRLDPAISTPGTPADPEANPAISTPGAAGRPSRCEPYRAHIEVGLEQGLSAQRIYQDLVLESGFEGGYQSVKRFVRGLRRAQPRRFHRMESLPGEEAQVDFGSGPRVADADGRGRRTWIFRIVLSHSRKGYSEAVYRQSTEEFIRCLENAFRHFGGVVQLLVIDNLRAAVKKADWFEPELSPKVEEFCRHYATLMLPTRPYHPHHKGKVENSVGYVKDNAVKGRRFASLAALNRHLAWWEEQVADRRVHGTTRKQVGLQFEQVERPALQSLPAMPFPFFQEARRTVHRDSHVEVAHAYYEAPPEYVGREVWVRWDTHTVRIFNHRLEQLAIHARHPPGQFSSQHQRPGRGVERAASYYRQQAALMGGGCAQWSEAVVRERGVAAVRILQGLLSLAKRHSAEAINAACSQALCYEELRLGAVRRFLEHPDRQQHFPLLERHALIRPMSVYEEFTATPTPEVHP